MDRPLTMIYVALYYATCIIMVLCKLKADFGSSSGYINII